MAVQNTTPEDAEANEELLGRRGCCFWLPCFGGRRSGGGVWERIRTSESHKEETSGWMSRSVQAFKRVREWSELAAGPRWKTFIRRFNKRRSKPGKFNYDPVSYALNFDDGSAHGGDLVDDHVHRDFSSRYAPIPATPKSPMESGKGASSSFT